jgi:hypothetical protein
MSRGYVFTKELNEEDPTDKIKIGMIEKLVAEWNELHTKIEQNSFIRDMDRDSEDDYHYGAAQDAAYDAIEKALEENEDLSEEQKRAIGDAAEKAYYEKVRKKENEDHEKLSVIEGLLSQLGARMMRPYEHWNEEEKLVEYLETRYDNEY